MTVHHLSAAGLLAPPLASSEGSLAPGEVSSTDADVDTESRTPRDIVLINPSMGGFGDIALGNKLAELALSQGSRVTLVRPSHDPKSAHEIRHLAPAGAEPHTVDQLQDPLIVSAPSSMTSGDWLKTLVDEVFGSQAPFRGDLALIDEMDLTREPEFDKSQRATLRKAGFRSLSVDRLGFAEGAIGYLPLSGPQIASIRRQAPAAIANFVDSLNADLSPRSPAFLAYVSAPLHGHAETAAHFIHHTLKALPAEARSATYLIVTGDISDEDLSQLLDELGPCLREVKDIDEKPARRFRHARIVALDPGATSALREVGVEKGRGPGRRTRPDITIAVTRTLPSPVFRAALAQAEDVMTSGDQSLSEALSLRETLPFYALPEWKLSLRDAVRARAYRMGGESLERAVAVRFMGTHRTEVPKPSAAERQALDREIVAHTADGPLRRLFTRA